MLSLVCAAIGLPFALPNSVAHTRDYLISRPGSTDISVDGELTAPEWLDARTIDLDALPGKYAGNDLPTFLRIKHTESFLLIAFDVVGDSTPGERDQALVAFDTRHDGVASVCGEDQFREGGALVGGQDHLVHDGRGWILHDGPYEPTLKNHAGLASAMGYGPSDLAPEDHRTFEFRIPLKLLGTSVGDVLGFQAHVIDGDGGTARYWPQPPSASTLAEYGDLILDTRRAVVRILPPSQTVRASPGEQVTVLFDIVNGGQTTDTFDLAVTSAWNFALRDSSGLAPLGDVDEDGLPDTGLMAPGGTAKFAAVIQVPSAGDRRLEAVVTATSSAFPESSASALAIVDVPPVRFKPPHTDYGLDTSVPPDGMFDELVVAVSVNALDEDFYLVSGSLFDANFTTWIWGYTIYTHLEFGENAVPLRFSGLEIRASGVDGPYRLLLTARDPQNVVFDRGEYVTAAYRHTDFQMNPILFRRPHADEGADTDGDGIYNSLIVHANVTLFEARTYLFEAMLYDPRSAIVGRYSEQVSLSPGNQTVLIRFDGAGVRDASADGEFIAAFSVRDGYSGPIFDSDYHVTKAYERSMFESEAGRGRTPTSQPDIGILELGPGANRCPGDGEIPLWLLLATIGAPAATVIALRRGRGGRAEVPPPTRKT